MSDVIDGDSKAGELKRVSSPSTDSDSTSAEQGLSDKRHLHRYLARLCASFVAKHADAEDMDVSYEEFVTSVPLCEWLPQRQRIEAWIATCLKDVQPDVMPVLSNFQPGADTQTRSIWFYILTSCTSQAGSWAKTPSYLCIGADRAVRLDELILQQTGRQNELQWDHLQQNASSLRFSFEFLMSLLRVYHLPLKLLAVIGPLGLISLMDHGLPPEYAEVYRQLARRVSSDQETWIREVCHAHAQLLIVRSVHLCRFVLAKPRGRSSPYSNGF